MTSYIGAEITAKLFTNRGHNQVMNLIHRETMAVIRDQFWPFHFMPVAFSRYGSVFVKRTARYMIRKARILHHQRPNEWSGDLKRSVLSDSVIRATAKRGTLQAKAPLTSKITYGPYGNRVKRRPLTDERRREMEVVSPEEMAFLMKRQEARYLEMAQDPRFVDVVRQRIR